jgi:succinyl-diaminopimelate desuccinylase
VTTPTLSPAAADEIRDLANDDHPSVVELLRDLVRIPSRGRLDPYDPVLKLVGSWLADRGLAWRYLHDEQGDLVGLVCDVVGGRPGPRYVLDACADTAPFGDEAAWRHPPTSAVVEDGWLYGRGSADSKAAIAIFSHLAARLRQQVEQLAGTVTLLFDADEHTGRFGGARRYFSGPDVPDDVAGVMIGYPGPDHVVVGCRGFLRAAITVTGTAGHSGSSKPVSGNAVEKAAELVHRLVHAELPTVASEAFPLPPKLTVTAVHGGEASGGYTIVPDRCMVHVDVRLTPAFDAAAATTLLEQEAMAVDREHPTTRQTLLEVVGTWPAYRLDSRSLLSRALLHAADRATGRAPRPKVAGPSNIGNYLAELGIEATAGFGVAYRNAHGTDECIELSTIPSVQAAYHEAVVTLLSSG